MMQKDARRNPYIQTVERCRFDAKDRITEIEPFFTNTLPLIAHDDCQFLFFFRCAHQGGMLKACRIYGVSFGFQVL